MAITETPTAPANPYRDTERLFTRDIAEHEMTVLHDDGLYRHLRFNAPNTGFYWFDLVTWPGNLAIRGDMGSYVFNRSQDMFAFFRLHGAGINPGYWAEKCVAGSGVREYSEGKFRRLVAERIAGYVDEHPGLAAAVQEQILDSDDLCIEQEARELLDSFEHDTRQTAPALTPAKTFRFTDTWEWDLHDYTHSYLWCCHAIRWGISQYDAMASTPAG